MDEYISKGDAIFAVSALPLTLDAETTQRAIEAVRAVPAADVVKVVQCKDCKHRDDNDMCFMHHDYGEFVYLDGYCNYAEEGEE